MFNVENLTYLRNSLLAEREKLQEILSNPPGAHLIGRKRKNGSYQVYIHYDADNSSNLEKDIYVNKSLIPKAAQIAQYTMAKLKFNELNTKLKFLDAFRNVFEKTSSFNIYLQKHPWMRQFLDIPTNDREKLLLWKNRNYVRNWDYPERIKQPTIVPGLLVRSKSEADIVSRFEYFGVPYHYDVISYFNGVRVNIDFVCLNVTTGKTWYWDHRGMLDNPSYIEKTLFCERQFLNAGIIQGINLIVTSETSDYPLSMLEIDAMIQHYLL